MGDESEALSSMVEGISANDEKDMNITCKRCNKNGFHWEKYFSKWRLHDINNNLHNCSKVKK